MLLVNAKQIVYLAIQAIDFRKGIDGLAAVCRQQFSLDPFSSHYFIFRNRPCSAIKVLVYDCQGFWLCHKRLSKGHFRYWPATKDALVILDPLQLQVLLQNGNPANLDTEGPWRS